jgi:hypothetical protein
MSEGVAERRKRGKFPLFGKPEAPGRTLQW